MGGIATVLAGMETRKETARHNREMEKANQMVNKAMIKQGESASELAKKTHKLEKRKFKVAKKRFASEQTMQTVREDYLKSYTNLNIEQQNQIADNYLDERIRQGQALHATGQVLKMGDYLISEVERLRKGTPEEQERALKIVLKEKGNEDFSNAISLERLRIDSLQAAIQALLYKDTKQAAELSQARGVLSLFFVPGGEGMKLFIEEFGKDGAERIRSILFKDTVLDSMPPRTRDDIIKELGIEPRVPREEGATEAPQSRRPSSRWPGAKKRETRKLSPSEEEGSSEEEIVQEAKGYGLDPIKMQTDYPELTKMLRGIKDPVHLTKILQAMAWGFTEAEILKSLSGNEDNGK